MPVVKDCTEVILLKGAPSLDHFVMVLSSEQENKLFSFDQATEVAISLCSPALTLMFNFIILLVLVRYYFPWLFSKQGLCSNDSEKRLLMLLLKIK